MTDLIIYALAVYWLFHLLTRSDLFARPRGWAARHAPKWLSYVGSCAFCFTFHWGLLYTAARVVFTGWLWLDPVVLLAAPVVNLVLDLVVRALIRANEPPVVGSGKTITCGDQSVTTWSGASTVLATAVRPVSIGQLVSIAPTYRWTDCQSWLMVHIPAANVTGEDVRGYAYPIVEAAWRAARERDEPPTFNPLAHEQTK